MKTYTFPVGVVALDIDAPTRVFWDGERLGDMLVRGTRDLADLLSQKWRLGRFWVYRTKSGCHVVFERVFPFQRDVDRVLTDANNQPGFHCCGGYALMCEFDPCMLRVGRKGEREWDIRALDEVDESAPWFVKEHHRLITLGGVE